MNLAPISPLVPCSFSTLLSFAKSSQFDFQTLSKALSLFGRIVSNLLVGVMKFFFARAWPSPTPKSTYFFNGVLSIFPLSLLFVKDHFPEHLISSISSSRKIILSQNMLAFPIALVLLTVSFLGWAPSVTADVLERLQCWCRNRASNSDAHNDSSLLQIVYHNNFIKNPVYIEHQCKHGYCVGIAGERGSFPSVSEPSFPFARSFSSFPLLCFPQAQYFSNSIPDTPSEQRSFIRASAPKTTPMPISFATTAISSATTASQSTARNAPCMLASDKRIDASISVGTSSGCQSRPGRLRQRAARSCLPWTTWTTLSN